MITIYKITSTKGNKVYIGSTSNYEKRKKQHIQRSLLNGSIKQFMEEYDRDSWIFNIIEECSKEIRYERERHWIENTANTINIRKRVAITKKEDTEYHAEYYKTNITKIKEQAKKNGSVRIQCDICGVETRKDHYNRHKKLKHSGANIQEQ